MNTWSEVINKERTHVKIYENFTINPRKRITLYFRLHNIISIYK